MHAATVALAAVAAVAAVPAQGATVTVRVERTADPTPLFDGTVSTLPHPVDGGDGSGPHPCSGPPGETPAPTATGALDDALRGTTISWRGNWDPSFNDFFIDRIGPFVSASPDSYWSLTVNGKFSAGGCLTRVGEGDAVRFFYGPLFGTPPAAGGGGGSAGVQQGGGESGKGASGVDGRGPSSRRLRRVAAAAEGFLRRSREAGEAWAQLALDLRRDRGPAAAATRLLAGRLGEQERDGSFGGGDVNATATAVLALRKRQPRRAARAAAWLAVAQSSDGGFGYRAGASSDLDTTGLATWALALMGRRSAAQRGGRFVRAAQVVDGGFPALPGGSSNSQSTGLATVALRVSGIDPHRTLSPSGQSPLDYLASLARRNGSIGYRRGNAPTPVWTTAQALLGLTTRAKLLDLDAGRTAG
jgi:hypothetical protein